MAEVSIAVQSLWDVSTVYMYTYVASACVVKFSVENG